MLITDARRPVFQNRYNDFVSCPFAYCGPRGPRRKHAGAARALEIFHEEIRRNMALIGVNTIAELGPQYLKFIDTTLRPRSRAQLRAVDDARAVAEA